MNTNLRNLCNLRISSMQTIKLHIKPTRRRRSIY